MDTDNQKRIKKCVMGCTNIVHSFCPTDDNCRELWKNRLGLKFMARTSRLCDKHFSQVMFCNKNKSRLREGAMPDISISNINGIPKAYASSAKNIISKPKVPIHSKGYIRREKRPVREKLPRADSLQTISLQGCTVLAYVDVSTFANDKLASEEQDISKKPNRLCVLRCKDFETLHCAPCDEVSLDLWKKKLRLTTLKKNQFVCNKHFTKTLKPGELVLPNNACPDSRQNSDVEEDDDNSKKNWGKASRIRDEKEWKRRIRKQLRRPICPEEVKKNLLACN